VLVGLRRRAVQTLNPKPCCPPPVTRQQFVSRIRQQHQALPTANSQRSMQLDHMAAGAGGRRACGIKRRQRGGRCISDIGDARRAAAADSPSRGDRGSAADAGAAAVARPAVGLAAHGQPAEAGAGRGGGAVRPAHQLNCASWQCQIRLPTAAGTAGAVAQARHQTCRQLLVAL